MADQYIPLYLYLENDVFLQPPQELKENAQETYYEFSFFDNDEES